MSTTIIEKVSQELNIPVEVVNKVYKTYWKYIRDTFSNLPLKEDLSEEDFAKLKIGFNLPSLGKFYCDYKSYLRKRKQLEYIKKNGEV